MCNTLDTIGRAKCCVVSDFPVKGHVSDVERLGGGDTFLIESFGQSLEWVQLGLIYLRFWHLKNKRNLYCATMYIHAHLFIILCLFQLSKLWLASTVKSLSSLLPRSTMWVTRDNASSQFSSESLMKYLAKPGRFSLHCLKWLAFAQTSYIKCKSVLGNWYYETLMLN